MVVQRQVVQWLADDSGWTQTRRPRNPRRRLGDDTIATMRSHRGVLLLHHQRVHKHQTAPHLLGGVQRAWIQMRTWRCLESGERLPRPRPRPRAHHRGGLVQLQLQLQRRLRHCMRLMMMKRSRHVGNGSDMIQTRRRRTCPGGVALLHHHQLVSPHPPHHHQQQQRDPPQQQRCVPLPQRAWM